MMAEHDRFRMGGASGFSLIEMMVVIVIAGIIVSIVWLRLSYLAPRYRLEGATRNVAAEIQKARGRAIAEGKCVRVSFQAGANPATYTVDTALGTPTCSGAVFSGGSPLNIEDSGTIDIVGTPVSAIFNPRGGSEGTGGVYPTIPLRNNLGDVRTVFVNPAGRVSVQ
jgi:prepilin-type N-terminal cleavage/methylation domain-containing protein